MTNNEMWNAPDIVPSITYSDLPRAVEWLQRVFGFRERAQARLTWAGGGMTWIEVGNSLFNISTPDDTWRQGSGVVAPGFVMKVYVEDVDKHFARAQSQGATIIAEPQDGFWGGRIYRALDHEGHQWEISQRGRDLAAPPLAAASRCHAWSKRMTRPPRLKAGVSQHGVLNKGLNKPYGYYPQGN